MEDSDKEEPHSLANDSSDSESFSSQMQGSSISLVSLAQLLTARPLIIHSKERASYIFIDASHIFQLLAL